MAGRLVYGLNAVREALRAGNRVNRLYLAKESRAASTALLDAARKQGVPFDFVPQAKLNAMTETHEHQGVAAAISPVEYVSLEHCLAGCPSQASLLLLDRIQHPKNVGLLIRTAAGAGAAGVLLTARGGALPDDAVLRASAGALFHVPVVCCHNLAEAIRALQRSGFWVYGLDAKGAENVFEVAWADRSAIVVGNESGGLRPGIRKACDALVRIPLTNRIDSLNAAVAAGIALFQAAKERLVGEGGVSHRHCPWDSTVL